MANHYKRHKKTYVAVDCIIFGFGEDNLKILLVKRDFEPEKGKWSLMGGFLKKRETLDDAAIRILNKLTGLHDIYMEQLKSFSDPSRDPVSRTVSTAYFALINIRAHDEALTKKYDAQWFNVNEIPSLIFDHDEMVELALRRLRFKASTEPVGFELLPEKFTMRQLQSLYEAILGEPLDKRNFIKKMTNMDVLIKLDEKDMTSSKKGSFLYRFDEKKYNQYSF